MMSQVLHADNTVSSYAVAMHFSAALPFILVPRHSSHVSCFLFGFLPSSLQEDKDNLSSHAIFLYFSPDTWF